MRVTLLIFIFMWSTVSLIGQCDFSISDDQPCAGSLVTVTVSDPDGSLYGWDFDNDEDLDAFGISTSYTFPISFENENYSIDLYDDDDLCESLEITLLGAPDANIGLVPGGDAVMNGNNITACNESANVSIELFNNSQTCDDNTLYEFDWGDGSVIETHTNTTFACNGTATITHMYSGFGYQTITLTVTKNNGCKNTETFTFYSGGNPSIALGNPGNTIGLCAPAVIAFPISNYENNPAGTAYFIYVNDVLVATFDQNTIPSVYEHSFVTTSCGESTADGLYNNAFDIRIDATNPCGSTTGVVEPIEVSTLPQASFAIDEPDGGCPGEIWTFTDNSTGINEILGNPAECINELLASWSITPNEPGTAWDLVDGSLFGASAISVEFLQPGTYTVSMTLNSQACGPSTVTQTIFVLEPPNADAEVSSGATDGCAPQTLALNNLSTGLLVSYNWTIVPATGWIFINGTNPSSEHPVIQFNEAGEYTITLTTSNVCADDTWTTTVAYAAVPTMSLNPIADECQVATLNFNTANVSYLDNGEPITTYKWNFPEGSPSMSSDPYPTNIEYTTAGEHIVSCMITNACGSFMISDTFFIEEPVALSLPDDMTLCEDDPIVTLSADPSGGIWSGTGVINDNLFDPSQANDSNTLTYTYGDCVSTGTIVITINASPTINITNNVTSACVSESAVALNAEPVDGIWISSGSGVLIGNIFSPAQSGVGDFTLTYTYIDPQTGCEASEQFLFTVHPLPVVSAVDITYCDSPGLVDLPMASPVGGTWTGTGVVGGQFDPQGPGVGMNNALIYTYENPNTLCENSVTINVSVIPLVDLEVMTPDTFCAEPILFDLNTLVNEPGGEWDSNGSGGLNGSIFNPAEAGAGNHTLTYSNGATGNCRVSESIEIYVNDLPQINIGNNSTSACVSVESIVLNVTPGGGNWSVNNGGVLIDNLFYPQASGVGEYTLTYDYLDLQTGCEASDQFSFTVNPLPVVASNDTTYCNNPGLVNLPFATPSGGVWSGPGVVGNQFNPTEVGVTTVELTYTFSDGSDCRDSTMIMVTVIAPVDIDAGPDTILCSNQGPYPLSGSPGNGTWSGTGVLDGVFYPDQAGGSVHNLTYSIGAGNCLVQDFIEIEVIHEDVFAGDDENTCITTAPFLLQGNSPLGGTWSGPGVIDDSFDPMLAGVGAHIITYAYEEPFLNCVFSASKIITVHELANSDFSFAPDSSCIGQGVIFTNLSTNTDNPYWDFGDGNFSTEVNPTHIYNDIGVYEVQLLNTTDFQCADSTSQTISIDEVPTPFFEVELIPGCEGMTVVLSSPVIDGDDYTLDYAIGSSTNAWVDTLFFEGQEDTVVYNISLTSTNYCGTTTFNAEPIVVPPIFNAAFGIVPLNNQNNIFCSPFEAIFADISTGEIDSFFFFYGTGDSSINIIDTFTYVNTTDSILSFTATLIIYGGGCIPDTARTEISLLPVNFTAAFNVSDTTLCENEVLTINDFTTPTTLIEYYQFEMGNGDTITLEPDAVDDFEYLFPETGTFTITLTASDGCTESSFSTSITVVPIPNVELNIQDEGCVDEEIVMAVETTDTLLAITLEINEDTILYALENRYTFDTPGLYLITLTATNPISDCSTVITKELLIRAHEGLPLLVSEEVVCDVLNVDIFADEVDLILWGDGGFSAPETGVSSLTHRYTNPGNYFVELFNTDEFGCEHKETYNVDVFENDLIVIADPDTLIALGEIGFLNAMVSGTGPFAYEWTPANQVADSSSLFTSTDTLKQTTRFTIMVSNSQGCRASDAMIIRLENEGKVFIPNVFSPNGDLINDWFTVYAGAEVANISKMIIADRWGEIVFSKNNFPPNIESEGWDGFLRQRIIKKDLAMNAQVFAYKIEVEYLNGDRKTFLGDVTLVK